MSLAEKKQNLLYIIEEADEKLAGLLIAVANEYNSSGEEYTKDEIESFYKTRDELLKNPGKGFTVQDAHQRIRNKVQDGF
ncbi:MAG: hypothetical protein M3Z92_03820 [Bacteroidota bacterium]|nr:hypothetical protein [Bacteroidota bacterium]